MIANARIASLPDDLRAIAEDMLAEKFGEPDVIEETPDDIMGNVWNAYQCARELNIKPKFIVMNPTDYRNILQSDRYTYGMDFGLENEQATTIFGMEVRMSSLIEEGDLITLDKDGLYGGYKR